jgi:hypothetical protein
MEHYSKAQFESMPPWLQHLHQTQGERTQSIAGETFKHYPGHRLAEIPADIRHAHALGREQSGRYRSHLERAKQIGESAQGTFPQHAAEYMNPYQQQVVSRLAEEGNRNFREQILPSLEAQFVRAGQHGSSKHRQHAARLARESQNEILGRQGQALAAGYQQSGQLFNADMARRLESAREAANLGTSTQAGLAGELAILGEQGRYQQQQEQALKDLKFQDYLREINFPKEQAAFASAMYHGIPATTNTTSYGATPAGPQTNIAGNLAQMAAVLGSAYNRNK